MVGDGIYCVHQLLVDSQSTTFLSPQISFSTLLSTWRIVKSSLVPWCTLSFCLIWKLIFIWRKLNHSSVFSYNMVGASLSNTLLESDFLNNKMIFCSCCIAGIMQIVLCIREGSICPKWPTDFSSESIRSFYMHVFLKSIRG